MNDKSVIADADVIQRYLLGHLPEDQQVKVEERLFTDDAFFGQIELAEDALIDAYISGKLSNEEIVQFEDQFLTTAARRKALEASKTIRESYINKPPPVVSWQTFWTPMPPCFAARLWSAAPMMLVLLLWSGVIGYLAIQLRHDLQLEVASRDARIYGLDRLLKQRTEEAVLQQPTALKQDTKDTKRRLPLAIPTPFAASQVVRQSPDFIINTVDHRQILLSEHRGKVVALLFILTGCPHCQECVASLSKLQGEYGHQGFQALAATIDETANRDVRLFLQQVRPTFPIGFAHRSAVIQYLQHTPDRRMMMPQLVMVDRSGMIREQHSGDHPYFEHAMREKNLRASIEGLLGRR